MEERRSFKRLLQRKVTPLLAASRRYGRRHVRDATTAIADAARMVCVVEEEEAEERSVLEVNDTASTSPMWMSQWWKCLSRKRERGNQTN